MRKLHLVRLAPVVCLVALFSAALQPSIASGGEPPLPWNLVTGHVFEDIDGDRSFDRSLEPGDSVDRGLSGTVVELLLDGYPIGVTRTDADGLYRFGGPDRQNLLGNWNLEPQTTYTVRLALDDPSIFTARPGKSNRLSRLSRRSPARTEFASVIARLGSVGDTAIRANFAVGPGGPVGRLVRPEISSGANILPADGTSGNGPIDFGPGNGSVESSPAIPEGTVPGIKKVWDVINIPNDGNPLQRGLWIKCLDLTNGPNGATEYEMIDATLTEFDDGTASLVGTAELPGVGSFAVDFFYYGFTEIAPPNSPKLPSGYTPDTTDWFYYTGFYGNLQGIDGTAYEGARVNVLGDGPAFQVGEGGSLFTPSLEIGASAWFTWTLAQNSNPPAFRDESECDTRGDINVDLQCRPEGCGGLNVLDRFNTVSYANDDGSIPWKAPWEERDVFNSGCYRDDDDEEDDEDDEDDEDNCDHSSSNFDGNGPEQTPIYVLNGQLRLSDRPDTGELPSVRRCVDLSGVESATLSFDHFRPDNLESDDKLEAWVFNGDTHQWRQLFTLIGGNHDPESGSEVFDISDEISSHTCVKFRIKKNTGGGEEYFGIDNVEICTVGCGDGAVSPSEECDDGNNVSGDGCRGDCTVEVCGDGILDFNEECDDGNDTEMDGCENDCTFTVDCGNGFVDPGEQCDDGNDVSGDGCRPDCTSEYCGDGIRDLIEECDDGNNVSGDGCSAICTIESGPPARPHPQKETPTSSSDSSDSDPSDLQRGLRK